MTIRNTIMAAVLAVAVAPIAPALDGQEYELPDSLARYGLPADPNDLVRQVAEEGRGAWKIFVAGCPSGGGWAGKAFAAMTEAAETDPHVQGKLAWAIGSQLQTARDHEHGGRDKNAPLRCLSEHPRFEAWLAAQLRREWERGLLAPGADGMGRSVVVGTLLRAIVAGTEASTRDLVRDIARDPEVWEPWREDAARRLVDLHFGKGHVDSPRPGGPAMDRWVGAWQTALLVLAAGSPLPNFEWNAKSLIVQNSSPEANAAFEREYERALRAAGREAFWK